MTTQDADGRRGTVTTEADGRRRLVFRRSWPAPIEEVWSALTDDDRLARWIGRYEGARGAGGTGEFSMTFEGGEPAGQPVTIAECDPPRRLVLRWTAETDWRVELDLSSDGAVTTLVFTQVLLADIDPADIAGGWHWYLDKLEAEVAGGAGPGEWDAFWAEVGPGYRSTPG